MCNCVCQCLGDRNRPVKKYLIFYPASLLNHISFLPFFFVISFLYIKESSETIVSTVEKFLHKISIYHKKHKKTTVSLFLSVSSTKEQ